MSIQIKQNKKGWIATRGEENTQLTNNQLYPYLMQKKAEGYQVLFKA